MALTSNEKQQNGFLRVILEEIRTLRSEVKKLEADLKAIKKQLTELKPSNPSNG